MNKITVIDSIMGTGKTSFAIQLMKEAPETQKFMYITPFIKEVERIQKAIPEKNFMEPNTRNRKGSKLEGLKKLLTTGSNIASTHALFKRCDKEVMDLLSDNGYTLILDECMEVVEPMDIVQEDIDILFNSKTIVEDENKWIKWVGTDRDYDGVFKDVMEQCFNNNVYHYGKKLYLWTFPVTIFSLFTEVYIMTYLFDGQLQKYYFDIFGTEYTYKSVKKVDNRFELTDYVKELDMTEIRSHLHIYDGSLNNIGDGEYTFSSTDMKKLKSRPALQKQIQNNIYNFFRHMAGSKSSDNMWTTFKDSQNLLKGKGYTKGFVAVNSRATNEFRDRTSMAYVANRFTNPCISQFFETNGVKIDEEAVALSELVQWIWRSAIRDGKDVKLYIPSERMRTLLKHWLEITA